MIEKIIIGENIAQSTAEGIVNAANGFGYMGGKRCIEAQHKGVAESIQYISKGAVEQLSRAKAKEKSLFGYSKGSVFVTKAPNLQAICIIHAVTMRTPGSKAKFSTVQKLVPEIIKMAEFLHISTVAIPLLGTGTGGLSQAVVFDYFKKMLTKSNIRFWIYLPPQNQLSRGHQGLSGGYWQHQNRGTKFRSSKTHTKCREKAYNALFWQR